MSTPVISVENISKLYRLGEVGTGTLRHDFNRWWHRLRGKEDPYEKIDAAGQSAGATAASDDNLWALKDVSFEVQQGEVLGIIGRNGAGKSTLLKILSRVTTPTRGRIRVKGRIASLLEVGTGFHPELSGRDNIFLNGAILGMRKQEIARKLDEIVDFSGCERFIDTPVKRYSSGMYVRLAFAVAAHLEPEILVVDEVLAVGDAAFQKKCLGKMKSVSGQGRTVLFVSHNMTAVQSLCSRGVLMAEGRLTKNGPIDVVVAEYLSRGLTVASSAEWDNPAGMPSGGGISLRKVSAAPVGREPLIRVDTGVNIQISFGNTNEGTSLDCTLYVINEQGITIFENEYVFASDSDSVNGMYTLQANVPGNLLNVGRYYLTLIFGENQRQLLLKVEEIISFDVANISRGQGANLGVASGVVRPLVEWNCLQSPS